MNTLRSLFQQYVGQTSDEPFGLEVKKAEGIYVYDQHDQAYIDLIAGIGPAAVGHSHPKVVAAGKHQMDQYMHTMVYGEHIQQPQIELAEYLASLLPDPIQSTYFVNSGAEAAEAAMKLAKKATDRFEIIACKNAYHGSTHATSALMSDDTYARAFRPFIPGVRFIEYDNKDTLTRITNKTAAVFVETMQGEAGCKVASACFMRALKERCNQTGTLLVMDEIQTGLGRTGKPFGFMHYEIQPDILLLAKALGGGMPLGAFLTSRELMAEMSRNPILGHCTTFGGHPVSCATGKAAVEVIMENRLYEQAEDKALRFRSALQKHPMVKGISGKGLWMAVDVGTFEIVQQLMWWAKEDGLITDWFLYNDHSFRICPPLTITKQEIDEALDILLPILDRLEKKFG